LKEKLRYQELDALRGIAAIMVVLFHFTLNMPEAKFGFKYGVTGVDLFFIISGFVIFESINNSKSAYEFIVNRLSRLFPTYWVCVTITFILSCFVQFFWQHKPISGISIINYFSNLSMFQYYLNVQDLDNSYWTMIIEMLFYIFIVTILKLKLIKYIVLIGSLMLVFCVIYSLVLYPHYYNLFLLFYKFLPLINHFPLFFGGIIFHKIITEKRTKMLMQYYVLLALTFIIALPLFNVGGRDRIQINFKEYEAILAIYYALFILFVNAKLKFIVNKFTLFFGKISYSLYLFHQYFSVIILLPIFMYKFHYSFLLSSILSFIIVTIIATIINTYIEIPFGVSMKKRLLKTKKLSAIE